MDGQSYITTANANYIPLPPFGDHHIKLCADSCYGDDDPTQWPQPYLFYHSHFAAMPHPNNLDGHDIIWWAPTPGHFESPTSSPVSGLGKLSCLKYNKFRTSVSLICDHVTQYKASTPTKQNLPNLQPSVKWLQQVLDQLLSVQMLFCHMEFIILDLQRVWLHV